jgi:putative selenium metabolism hydrolase
MPTPSIRDEIIAFTQELVRLSSLPGREREVALAVHAKMNALNYDEVWTDVYGSVVGIIRGDGASKQDGPTFLFDSHTDTVEITSPEAWTHDPLGGEIDRGRIWGRGSTDMKGAIAATVIALGRLPWRASGFRGALAVSASVGEEVIEGAALSHIIPRVKPDFVIICEPTECKLGIGQKGRTGIRVSTSGKPAHTANPKLGDNAVYKMLPVIERLNALPLPKDSLLGDGVMELVEIQSLPFPGKSIVPDGCRAIFDRRLTRAETEESVLNSIRGALAGLKDWSVEYTTAHVDCYTGKALEKPDFHAGWAIDPKSEWLEKARRGLQAAGLPADFYAVPYCTNGSYSAGEAKLPTIVFGPSTIKLAHAIDEYIEIDELMRGAEGFVGLAKELTSP